MEPAPVEEVPSGKGRAHVRTFHKFREPLEFDLFPSALGEGIPVDHAVRHLARLFSEMDLGFVYELYEPQGGVPYRPENLLATIVFGRSDGVWGGRALEEHCRYDARYRFLMGGHVPDDRSFDRFLERIAPVADRIFKQVRRRIRANGRADAEQVALDGSRVAGAGSQVSVASALLSDPDSRVQNSHGRMMVGYNLQSAVDIRDGTLAMATVVADQADNTVMPAVLETMRSQMDSLPCAVVADTGFENHEAIELLETAGVDTCISFKDALPECLCENGEGELVCPAGRRVLPRWETRKRGRTYVAYGPSCKGCPLAPTCEFHRKRLFVPKGVDPGARFRNRSRCRSAQYDGALMRRRMAETPFGQLKRNDGFRGFRRRGLDKVRVDFVIWGCSYNLRKWWRALKDLFWHLIARMRVLAHPGTSIQRTRNATGLVCAD